MTKTGCFDDSLATGPSATLHLRRPDGVAAFQAHVTLTNGGAPSGCRASTPPASSRSVIRQQDEYAYFEDSRRLSWDVVG
ncbi:hypothetical protein [Actinocrinis sp.]|uniref:hypothetical protein n=1 Tax=Actinocrinis sp. TaxID=1920516 RepID=UPI002DDD3D9B|nr:hypothetical protein [Actinocrinis sp.]